MKRFTSLVLILVLLVGCMILTGCADCDHSYGNWTTIKAATCTEDGEKERTCSECGHKEKETIKASGHDYVGGICTECGKAE